MRNQIKEKYAANRHGKYSYSKLADVKAGAKEYKSTYVYAYVIDATSPFLPKVFNKYIVSLRICDPSYNPNHSNPSCKKSMKAQFFAICPLDLPAIKEVGSIIRIHRATAILYNKEITLNCDITTKGSWAVFELNPKSQNTKYKPIKYSNTSYAWVEEDISRLDTIRESSQNLLKSYSLFSNSISLEEGEKIKTDFDIKGYLLSSKLSKDNKFRKIEVCDETKVVKVEFNKEREERLFLQPGSTIRIRCCNYSLTKENNIFLEEYSNILLIPESLTSNEITAKVIATKNNEVKIKYKICVWPFEDYTLVRNNSNKKSFIPVKKIFESKNILPSQVEVIKVTPISIIPLDPEKWIRILNKGSISSIETPQKDFILKNDSAFGFEFEIECKDLFNETDENTYMISIHPIISKGFIPQVSKNLQQELKKLKLIKQLLLNTNCTLEIEVQKESKNLVVSNSSIIEDFSFIHKN